jgi:methyltransferase (TIGR00027 family)
MSQRQPSRTALATAYLRAAHQRLDAEPRVLDDPVAIRLLGAAAEPRLRDGAERFDTPAARALRAHVVLRSRYAEDRLAEAVRRGVSQYVILGAGFDTFALRQPDWARSLRILEVDHPGSQALKSAYLADAGLAMPANAELIEIDFEQESLLEGLRRSRVSIETPTFFSWLGVTMYLNQEAIAAALRAMASFPAGSEVVLTFAQPSDDGDRARLAERVAEVGEPFVSYFEPAELEALLRGAGFERVEFLSSAEADERYFKPRPRDLPPPRQTGIAWAGR